MDKCCCCCCEVLKIKVNAILELLISLQTGKAVDLRIVFGFPPSPHAKGNEMANKKASGPEVKCPCLAPKTASKKMIMPDVILVDPAPKSITLQPLDANGNVVALTPADTVQGTLASNSPNLAVVQAADTTHYTGTIPANTPFGSTADLAATLNGTIQGAQAALTSSVHVVINIPPNPVAVDLEIIFG